MLLLDDVSLDSSEGSSETFSSPQAAEDPPIPNPFFTRKSVLCWLLWTWHILWSTSYSYFIDDRRVRGELASGQLVSIGAGIQIQILIMLFPPHHSISPPLPSGAPVLEALWLLCPLTGGQLCGFCLLFRHFFPVPHGLWYLCSSVPCFLTSPVACTGIWETGELFYMMNPEWFTTGPYSYFWMPSHWGC